MNLKYRPDIDGLRAIAVLAVFIFHLNPNWLYGGFIGVDIFFVISGFLITSIIWEQGDNFNIAEFYNRRIKRILPIFYFVGFVAFTLSFLISLPDLFTEAFRSFKATTYFWQNIFFAYHTYGYFNVDVHTKPYLHTWSLAVEEQFYLIFPFVLILFHKFKLKPKSIIIILSLLAIASFACSYASFINSTIYLLNYYSLFTSRAGELLIGCIGAIIFNTQVIHKKSTVIPTLAFIALVFSLLLINGQKDLYPNWVAIIPTLSTMLIIYFADKNFWLTKFLSNSVLTFMGKISYSFYLWHWVVIVFCFEYFQIIETSVSQAFVIFILTLVLSLFSYYYIEQVFRKKPYSLKKSLVLFYLIPASLVLSTYYANQKYDFLNFGTQSHSKTYTEMTTLNNFQEKNCSLANPCVIGDTQKPAKILFIGDSHAQHLAPFLDLAGKEYGVSIEVLAKFNCPLTEKYMKNNDFKDRIDDCQKIIDQITNLNNLKKFNYIFIGGRYISYLSKEYVLELKELIQLFQKDHKQVVIFSDIPYIKELKLYEFKRKFIKHTTIDRKNFIEDRGIEKANEYMQSLAQTQQVYFINLFDKIINSHDNNIHWPFKGNYILYYDSNHFNTLAPKLLKTEFLEQVEKSPLDKIFKSINNNQN